MTRRRRLLVLALAAVVAGAICWLWGRQGWPARALVRGHLGDVAAAALVYALIAWSTQWSRKACAAVAAVVAVAIEVAQRGAPSSTSTARELALGAHFDAWDLVAYAAGVALAAACDMGFLGGERPAFPLRSGRGRGYGPPP